MEEFIIETNDLVKTFNLGEVKVEAVRGISSKVSKGEFLTIIGPSGSGKSTFLHLLGCLDVPTAGKYFLEGEDVSKFGDRKLAQIRNRKIGFVFQTFNLLPQLTVLENVLLPVLYNSYADLNKSKRWAINLLESFGLEKRLKNRPTQLSGGEMQRVAIARALINDPSIILADEPTGNLDSKTGLEIIKILKSLNEEKGVTEIIVTHDQNLTRFTKRTIKIRDGIVEEDITNHNVGKFDEGEGDLQ
ncbi:MAG: lipoprotein-releasing system ATP-binding protein LolD [Caldiserica bacterium CG02_land_8_20_14_3_00_36_38]|nr:ABC transporter ATP-binding protein [Caldisericota bacterium]PIV55145.1 MAG: lipoprotein-releasing system ATP-binding protein LolD [Caldiserica bacterium CG02_land_8_20_14_3_00_36_38]PIX29651.1 MAG: lipoprotein-releasing system ATP-binding protein LolD [Caldiserica bacterium CG_4_8_14_3_um_filter_35_18]